MGVVFIMYGVFAVGKRQGLELGIAAGTVNALGSTIDNAGNSISKGVVVHIGHLKLPINDTLRRWGLTGFVNPAEIL